MKSIIGTGIVDGEHIGITRVFNQGSRILVELADGRVENIEVVNLLQWTV